MTSLITVGGFITNTRGLDWLEIRTGSHTVCFSDVAGYTTPECVIAFISAGQTAAVEATFAQNGHLKVGTDPVLPGTIKIAEYAADDWVAYTDLRVGVHKVCFGDVDQSAFQSSNALLQRPSRFLAMVLASYALSAGLWANIWSAR